jgi:hypothetical protein
MDGGGPHWSVRGKELRERHNIYDLGKIFSVHMYIWNIILVSKFIMGYALNKA